MIQIINYFEAAWVVESPSSRGLWERELARCNLIQSCVTSYCSFGMVYKKDTRLANNFGLKLPMCLGAGLCPAMIGKRHREHAQKAGGAN